MTNTSEPTSKLPEILALLEKSARPLTVRLPPIEAKLVNSKLLETLALVAVSKPKPVILFEFPVTSPPKVKALMVKVPVD